MFFGEIIFVPMIKRPKLNFGWGVMLLVALALLYFSFRGVKWSDFVAGLSICNFWWVIASMAASICAFIFRGIRWRYLMLPLNRDITRKEAYDGVTIGYISNFAIPRAGEFIRCGVISSSGKASFESVLGSVVLERSWDMLCYVIALLCVILLRKDLFGEFLYREIWSPLVDRLPFDSLVFVSILVIILVGTIAFIYLKRETFKRFKLFRKLDDVVKGLIKGFVAGFKMEHKWRFILFTLLIWLSYWVMSITTILAFPEVDGLNYIDALFLMVVGSLGWIVPVQGGIGAYHFILSLALLSIYGIPQTSGVVFATISHESQALTMLICGTLSLISLKRKR